ncbi:MAG: hypothetical protein EOM50_15800, partial [Erysipelotrichia bacterium]|nr:hypothetical protein [Erysipelotrichia bacterium]
MRVSLKISLCLFVLFIAVLNNGCKKDPPKVLPTIETAIPTNITSTSATSGGIIPDDGGAPVINKGVCWSNNQFPTINDSKISNGSGIGSYTSIIIGLIPGSTYYLRSFAINVVGTAYGNQLVLSTLSVLPILTTTPCSSITSNTAISGGIISYDGGGAISERGICWNTNQNPTTSDNKLINGSGTGSFISNITGLTPGATYHLRAYAINSAGTAYGNQITITA